MIDFFTRQDYARKLSQRLSWLFFAAVIGTILLVNVLTHVVIVQAEKNVRIRDGNYYSVESDGRSYWHADKVKIQLYVTLVTLAIIIGGSWYKFRELRGGGYAIAYGLGARPARPDSDAKERQLVHVVEEMSLASGVPMPEVFVLDNEQGINAFAAGQTQHDAVVAVTRGTLDQLSRDELQGVIGHEFSHILNGDMRINMRMIGLLHGILLIALIGRMVMNTAFHSRSSSQDKNNGNLPIFLFGLLVLLIGSLGHLFGQLIKAAISRQREFLADASAVQFTRNPHGIGDALKKIGGATHHARIYHPRAAETSHFYFANGLNKAWFSLFATHPPLDERIRRIDPAWSGETPSVPSTTVKSRPAATHPLMAGFAAESVVSRIGTVTDEHLEKSTALHAQIPQALLDAAHDAFSARAIILTVLLGERNARNLSAYDIIERQNDHALRDEIKRWYKIIIALPAALHSSIITLSLPAISQLSPRQRAPFVQLIQQVAHADGVLDPREYCLTRLIFLHLSPPPRRQANITSLNDLLAPVQIVLSALVYFGQQKPEQQLAALRIAAGLLQHPQLELLPVKQCGPEALDKALAQLPQASPGLKRKIMHAAAHCVSHDCVVGVQENDMLRIIGMIIEVPVPL
jgi:Zn-dependent protease with chaperone function